VPIFFPQLSGMEISSFLRRTVLSSVDLPAVEPFFLLIFINATMFGKRVIEDKMSVLIFSTILS
jgi:hypothetical protein